jgi:hypothetical protein
LEKASREIPQYIGGSARLSKLAITCQSPHFGKIAEIKSISKPLMMGRNLHSLTEYVNRRVQEVFLGRTPSWSNRNPNRGPFVMGIDSGKPWKGRSKS